MTSDSEMHTPRCHERHHQGDHDQSNLDNEITMDQKNNQQSRTRLSPATYFASKTTLQTISTVPDQKTLRTHGFGQPLLLSLRTAQIPRKSRPTVQHCLVRHLPTTCTMPCSPTHIMHPIWALGLWHFLTEAHCQLQSRTGSHAGLVCGRRLNEQRLAELSTKVQLATVGKRENVGMQKRWDRMMKSSRNSRVES